MSIRRRACLGLGRRVECHAAAPHEPRAAALHTRRRRAASARAHRTRRCHLLRRAGRPRRRRLRSGGAGPCACATAGGSLPAPATPVTRRPGCGRLHLHRRLWRRRRCSGGPAARQGGWSRRRRRRRGGLQRRSVALRRRRRRQRGRRRLGTAPRISPGRGGTLPRRWPALAPPPSPQSFLAMSHPLPRPRHVQGPILRARQQVRRRWARQRPTGMLPCRRLAST